MANTKLPARLLDDSVIPAAYVSGTFAVDTNTLRVDAVNNRVGIGITSPDEKLHIKGDGARIYVDSADHNLVSLGRRGSSGADLDHAYLRMKSAGTNTVILDTNGSSYFNGGNVGINTTSPETKLDISRGTDTTVYSTTGDQRSEATITVRNLSQTTGTFAGINFYTGGGTGSDWSINNVRTGSYAGDLTFKTRAGGGSTDWRERMRILNNGNVGIGVTDPTANLEIYKAVTTSHVDFLKLTMPSWSQSVNYLKNIVWEDGGSNLGGIGLLYDGGKAIMHFHSFYNSGYKSESDILMTLTGAGRLGIGESAPDRRLHVKSGANSNDGAFRIESANNNIMDMGTGSIGHFLNCVNTDPFSIKMAGVEKFRIDNSASAGHLQAGIFGVTGLNTSAAIHGAGNDAALVLSNGALAGTNSGYAWAGRGNRYLTSNGTNWTVDGSDPALVISQNTANDNRGNGLGIILHNDSNTDNHYGPMVGWGTKSASNSYNSMYAYIVGKRTGTGVDTNWNRGELQFDTAGTKFGGSDAYFNDIPAMTITENGAVIMPYQPSFKVAWSSRNATGSSRFLSGNDGDSQYTGRDSHNTGNHFSVATGRFTVPVAGTYFFGFHGMRNGTNGSYLECRIKKNGGLMWARAYQAAFDQAHQYWAITTISDCAVGDYIQVHIGPNTSIYYDDTYFYGYLMG